MAHDTISSRREFVTAALHQVTTPLDPSLEELQLMIDLKDEDARVALSVAGQALLHWMAPSAARDGPNCLALWYDGRSARFRHVAVDWSQSRDTAWDVLRISLAGYAAEHVFGLARRSAPLDPLFRSSIVALAQSVRQDFDGRAWKHDDPGNPINRGATILNTIFLHPMDRAVVAQAYLDAKGVVASRQDQVRLVAALLLERGGLTGLDLRRVFGIRASAIVTH